MIPKDWFVVGISLTVRQAALDNLDKKETSLTALICAAHTFAGIRSVVLAIGLPRDI